jgi:hypothetical protein
MPYLPDIEATPFPEIADAPAPSETPDLDIPGPGPTETETPVLEIPGPVPDGVEPAVPASPRGAFSTMPPSLGDWDRPGLPIPLHLGVPAHHPPTHPGDVSPSTDPSTARSRPAWMTIQNGALASIAALALVGVMATIAITGNNRPPDPSQVTSLGPPNTDSDAQVLQGQVDALSRYVESARGLKFLHQVKATVYDNKDFDAHVQALNGAKLDVTAEESGRIATDQALGILALDYNPKSSAATDTSSILGYYDPVSKQLVVRGAFVSPYVRKTLVHELTHALQDQHFDLQKLLRSSDDDSSLAMRSLVEGDAKRIENGYISTLSPTEQDLLEREARTKGDEEFPIGYEFGFANFPYVEGSAFAQDLVARGGQAALDKAFANPPTSSKQILQPATYMSGEQPVSVSPPAAGGAIIDRGTIGEFELIYVLGQNIDLPDAAALTADWAGSSFVTWKGASGPCTRMRLANESAAGTERMTAALEAWASVDSRRSVNGGDPITVTSCV